MKKKIFVLILLLVVCSGLVTYALFRSNVSGNATVDAARWNVVFKNGESEIENNFNIQLSNATWTNPLGNVASGKIAPGSSATFYITLDATNTETDVDYTVEVDESFNVSDFEVTLTDDAGTIPYSTTSGAMIKQIPIRVVWTGNIDDNDDKNTSDLALRAQSVTIPIKITAAQKLPLKYTVNFNVDGVIVSSLKINENTAIGTLPASPTKVGYTFAGWYDAETNGNEVTTETLATSGMNIYAYWNIKYVTVTFDSDGGSSVSSQQIQEGSTINPIPSSTKTDYELIGWYNNDQLLTSTTEIMSDITYIAHWKGSVAGTVVYFDPVSDQTCTSSGGSSTCYKWRILNDDNNLYTLQMSKNFNTGVVWNSVRDNNLGPKTALTALADLTSSWTRVAPLTYEYDTSASTNNYGTLSCNNGICTISKTNETIGTSSAPLRARLITAEEVARVSGNVNWSLTNQSNINSVKSWLIDGMSGYAYWTLTPVGSNNTNAYFVDNRPALGDYYVNYGGSDRTIRPVITVNPTTTVTFNYQDGSPNLVKNYTIIDDLGSGPDFTNVTLGTLPTPNPRNDYTFLGWYTEDGTPISSSTLVPATNVTYYARWQVSKSGDSLLSILSRNDLESSNGLFVVNNEIYQVDLIVLNGNQTITSNQEYGVLTDCASGTETSQMAQKMVIVKVNGDYTINSGVTVGPRYNSTYGGPKGFLLYVTGTLTNNGIIDNSHGAYANGQDVYLYKNSNNTYETVPALGALGGTPAQAPSSNGVYGVAGTDGVNRQTGGGSSGAAWYDNSVSGAGGRGTSYSGGSGGGGVSRSGTTSQNNGGSSIGGQGGNGVNKGTSGNKVGGGAGNPGGSGTNSGQNGTGGLLIIYANNFNNNNKITANGYIGGNNDYGYGGSSGGGSINIFYNNLVNANLSSIEANGGLSPKGEQGGNGSITIGSISSGQFTKLN